MQSTQFGNWKCASRDFGAENKLDNGFKHVMGQETGPRSRGLQASFNTTARVLSSRYAVWRMIHSVEGLEAEADTLDRQAIALGLGVGLRFFYAVAVKACLETQCFEA